MTIAAYAKTSTTDGQRLGPVGGMGVGFDRGIGGHTFRCRRDSVNNGGAIGR